MSRSDDKVSAADRSHAIELAGLGAHATRNGQSTRRGTAVAVELDVGARLADGHRRVVVAQQSPDGSAAVAITDLNAETVTFAATSGQFQLSATERRRAEQIASTDARVSAYLAGRPMDALTRLSFPPPVIDYVANHRIAIVFLRPAPGTRAYAFVDLTVDQVLAVIDPDDEV